MARPSFDINYTIMEFSIDIHTQITGEITIEDFSKEYGQYIDENLEVVTSYDSYKYNESATLNTIIKIGVGDATLIDVLLNDHTEDLDSCTFKVKKDGYYVVDHIILPNMKWYKNSSDEYKEYYETIYVTDGEKLYKEVEEKLEECTVKEILERNIEGTTIKKCKVDVFFTGNLQQCYVNYCKKLFDGLLNECVTKEHEADIFARDFIWMTLNIVDYLIGFKQFMEAERLLAMFRTCGGFCNTHNHGHKHISCGCS